MGVITDILKLNPKATGSLPTGVEGALAYDSTDGRLKAYGTAWMPVSRATGSGGVETTYSTFKVHTFKSSGTFTISGGSITCDILVLGSGGSGGGGNSSNYGSGAGAGGMLWRPTKILGPAAYTISIGNGGSWTNAQTTGNKGTDCSFSGSGYTLTGNAGGAGSGTANSTQPADCTGGCGGGAGRDGGTNAAGASNQTNSQDSSAYAYGFAGGTADRTGCGSAGGGGGTGQLGQNGGYDCQATRAAGQSEGGYGRNSMDGVSNSEFIDFMWSAQVGTNTSQNGVGGSLVSGLGAKPSDIRLGAGGGGAYEAASAADLAYGGLGGGGRGAGRYPAGTGIAGTNALASTGSGGGAGQRYQASAANGGNGAGGVVIIRYAN